MTTIDPQPWWQVPRPVTTPSIYGGPLHPPCGRCNRCPYCGQRNWPYYPRIWW